MKLQKLICLVGFALTLAGTAAGQIKVEIKTLKIISGVRNEAMPRVKVDIGGNSTTTDDRGRGTIMVAPGIHSSKVVGQCAVNSVTLIGSVRRSGGTDKEPNLDFPFPSNQTPTVTFLMRCDTDVTPGMVRVKIGTTTSCTDDPNGAMKVQPGITVRIGDKEYTSDQKGVIDVELRPGRYPIGGVWQDYAFGYVTQNGLRIKPAEGGQPSVNLSDQIETLEVRMLTCDETGQEKARAEIVEIGDNILVIRSSANGRGFVGMKLRDGDLVKIAGTAKLRWFSGNGTISFDDPRGNATFLIGPDHAPPDGGQVSPPKGSLFLLKSGLGKFFFPTNLNESDLPHDENGNVRRFGASTRTIITSIKGTTFTIGHDETTETTTVTVTEGIVSVMPRFPGRSQFDLNAGQRAEISPTGVNDLTTGQENGPFVRPKKRFYAVGEPIVVDYGYVKSSGPDHVVIMAHPMFRAQAKGRYSAIDTRYQFELEPNVTEVRDRRGTLTFPGLPAGDYYAGYYSWAEGQKYLIENEYFKVGDAPPGPPQQPPTQPPTPLTPSPANDLTGLWRNPGSNVTYRLRQIGTRLYWGADGVSMMSFANIYYGDIKGNTVDGIWIDLPGSPYVGDGKIFLRIESDCRLVKTAEVNHYASEIWVRKNSSCDGGPSAPSPAKDLTGLWKNPGGEAIYRFRQVGSKLHWGIDAVPLRSFANKFEGDINGNVIEGKWLDLPGSPAVADGTLYLKIESECRIVKTGQINNYGAQVWVRKDSLCDVVGPPQKSAASDRVVVSDPLKQPAAQNTSTTKNKPKVEEIPDGVINSGPTGKTTTAGTNTNRSTKPVPKVEDIPDGGTTATTTKKPTRQKPRVQEIPDGEITVAKNDSDNGVFINETTTKAEQMPPVRQPQQEKPAKPKRTGPSIWEKLGTAINTAVTQQPPPTTQQPPPTGGGTTQQPKKPDGTCQGGSYWLGAPPTTPTSGFQIAWSSPIGADRHHFRTFRAGTSQFVGDNDQPQNVNACGHSWPFYFPAGQYDVYLYPGTFANTRNTNTGPVAGPLRVIVTP